MEEVRKEIDQIHDTFEEVGINSRGVCDVAGKKFYLPVDEEHKAKVFGMGIIAKGVQRERAFPHTTLASP